MRGNVIALALVLIAGALPAPAVEYRADGWEGYINRDDATGAPSSCGVMQAAEPDKRLGFVLRLNRNIGSGLIEFVIMDKSPSWQVTADEIYSVTYWTDGQFLGAGGVLATEFGDVLGRGPYRKEHIQRISKAGEMEISITGEKVAFPMKGATNAIEWLRACAEQNIARAWRSPSAPKVPATPNEPENLDDLDDILAAAGLINYVLVPQERTDESNTGEWLWGQGGGRQYREKKAARDFDAAFADTILKLKRTCRETRPSGFRDWTGKYQDGTAFGQSVFICIDENGALRSAVTVIDSEDNVTVFVHYGAVRVAVDAAADRVNAVIREMHD